MLLNGNVQLWNGYFCYSGMWYAHKWPNKFMDIWDIYVQYLLPTSDNTLPTSTKCINVSLTFIRICSFLAKERQGPNY